MFKLFLILGIFLFSHSLFAYDSEGIEFITVPKYRSIDSGCVYADVLNHSKQKPHGDQDGRYTNVHETAHGIHNELRNHYRSIIKSPINVLYCLNGKAVIVDDPNIKMRHVSPYVPEVLRSSRFKLYLVKQLEYWDDTPTYIFDEWTCYVLGAECAVDDSRRGRTLEKTNAVSGALEFSIYTAAFALAIKNINPVFWENNTQLKCFIKYNLIRAEKVFNTGSGIEHFHYGEQDRLLQALLKHPDAQGIRDFLKLEFDGIFVDYNKK
ncbi:hypothetical protein EB118_10295 [bacterium]|nr:hypothetical protein [bacterium]